MSHEIYCVFMNDNEGFVVGLFDNFNAAKACYKYHSSYFSETSLIPICTETIESEFIEPQDS